MEQKQIPFKPLLLSFAVLYGIWAVWELWLNPLMTSHLSNPWLSNLLGDGIVKNLVWTLPAFWLMGRYEPHLYVPRKELLTAKVNWLKWLPWMVGFVVFAILCTPAEDGRIGIAADFHPSDLAGGSGHHGGILRPRLAAQCHTAGGQQVESHFP